jgi:restriction system protein
MAAKKKEGAQFIRYFGPLLDALRELGGSARPAEASERVALNMKLSQVEQDDLLASGSPRFHNAVQWARFYLVREGLIDGSTKGVWSLTPIGWKSHRKEKVISITPDDEDIEDTVAIAPVSYRARVLEIVKSIPPDAFERLCQRLLRESDFISVTVTGRSGDGGIDGIGILQINPFVSFRVLFQCKRYSGSVSPSQVRDFRGAMLGRADKGIIITTGTFTQEARKEAFRDGAPPLELVDGDRLIDMFEHLKFGLQPRVTYEVDDSFFASFTNTES